MYGLLLIKMTSSISGSKSVPKKDPTNNFNLCCEFQLNDLNNSNKNSFDHFVKYFQNDARCSFVCVMARLARNANFIALMELYQLFFIAFYLCFGTFLSEAKTIGMESEN